MARRWFRQSWFWGALLAVGLQYFGFWLVSPEIGDRWRVRPPGRRSAAPSGSGTGELSELLWLWTPALPLTSGRDDFSAEGWMKRESAGIVIEAFAVPRHALPFLSARPAQEPRMESAWVSGRISSGIEWGGGKGASYTMPVVAPVRVVPEIRVRVADGSRRWHLAPDSPAGPIPADAATTPPVAVRLVLDGRGELLAPPLVWEGSGQPNVDAAAVESARRLRWVREGGPDPGDRGDSREWLLVVFEWGGGPKA